MLNKFIDIDQRNLSLPANKTKQKSYICGGRCCISRNFGYDLLAKGKNRFNKLEEY